MERIAMSQDERDDLHWLKRVEAGSMTQREAAEKIAESRDRDFFSGGESIPHCIEQEGGGVEAVFEMEFELSSARGSEEQRDKQKERGCPQPQKW